MSLFLNDHEELEPNLPHQWLIQQEDAKKLYLAISKLKLTYRDVIILRKIEELSIQETCDVLGWNEGKVKKHFKTCTCSIKKAAWG